jgi:hypothetical protein
MRVTFAVLQPMRLLLLFVLCCAGCGANAVWDINQIEFRNDWGCDKVGLCLSRLLAQMRLPSVMLR